MTIPPEAIPVVADADGRFTVEVPAVDEPDAVPVAPDVVLRAAAAQLRDDGYVRAGGDVVGSLAVWLDWMALRAQGEGDVHVRETDLRPALAVAHALLPAPDRPSMSNVNTELVTRNSGEVLACYVHAWIDGEMVAATWPDLRHLPDTHEAEAFLLHEWRRRRAEATPAASR